MAGDVITAAHIMKSGWNGITAHDSKSFVSDSQNSRLGPCKSDIDLNPMALILKLEMGMVKMWNPTKIKSKQGKGIQMYSPRTYSVKTLPSHLCGQ